MRRPASHGGRGIRIADFHSLDLTESKIYKLKSAIDIIPLFHKFGENAVDQCQNFLSTRRTF